MSVVRNQFDFGCKRRDSLFALVQHDVVDLLGLTMIRSSLSLGPSTVGLRPIHNIKASSKYTQQSLESPLFIPNHQTSFVVHPPRAYNRSLWVVSNSLPNAHDEERKAFINRVVSPADAVVAPNLAFQVELRKVFVNGYLDYASKCRSRRVRHGCEACYAVDEEHTVHDWQTQYGRTHRRVSENLVALNNRSLSQLLN
ncbi:hypothetical protein DL96DRAFT_1742275 [Flagelloscypha sp. PMI_526]|nr:hypothetical protein DL96DRAFT_1742275 [Flagelloscypha sp. PMI_526]